MIKQGRIEQNREGEDDKTGKNRVEYKREGEDDIRGKGKEKMIPK